MLSISKAITGAGQCDYYLALASRDDYYLDAQEAAGFWLGVGARALRLQGTVRADDFRHLFRGLSTDGATRLVRNAESERRRAAWDLTWSVPKSVSTAWSQAPEHVRFEIEATVNAAVGEGTRYLESIGVVSRRGEDGVVRERGRLIMAAFPHSTSRAQDPQLHVHTVLLNVAVRDDGSTGTVEPREIFRHQHAADAIFRAELAAQLEARLGLRAMREGRAFELLGVDRELMAAFSTRREEILAAMATKGVSGPRAAEVAAFDTRRPKESVSRQVLFETWHRTGLAHGWSERQLAHLLHAPFPARDFAHEREQVINKALERLTAHHSHFSLRELTMVLAEEAQGRGLPARDVLAARDELVRSQQVVHVGAKHREPRYSTPEMLRLEAELLQAAAVLHRAERTVPGVEGIVEPILAVHDTLSAEQRCMVESVTGSDGGLHLVTGMAGTGKSFAFGVARQIWEAEGLTVHGTALAGKAALSLQEGSGIQSRTLHRLLWGIEQGLAQLDPHSVVVLDEAAMVGTRQLRDLVIACEHAHAKLVLVGDAAQLQAIEPGGGFAALARDFGASSLTEIRRQREEWARQAVHDFADGDSGEAFAAFDERGLIRWAPTATDAEMRLISDWSGSFVHDPSGSLILAGTNAEVSRLNAMAQRVRQGAQMLGDGSVPVGSETVFVNDRVLFTRNSQALAVFNGELGTVIGCSQDTLTVAMDRGRQVNVRVSEFPHLRLGYAMTVHKAQGTTVEEAFVLAGSMQDRELTYVEASRARGATRFYVGGEDLPELAMRAERSRRKELASRLPLHEGPSLELEHVR